MKNFLTSILLLVIIFWVLHNFLDFSVKDIPNYFERLGGNLKSMFNKDQKVIEPKKEKKDIKEDFNKYIKSLISKNQKKIEVSEEKKVTSESDKKTLLDYLKKVFSVSNNHTIRSLKSIEDINQINVENGIYYPSVKIKGDYYFDKKKKFNVSLDLEILLIFDSKDAIFLGPINMNGKSAIPQITNINVIEEKQKAESEKKIVVESEKKEPKVEVKQEVKQKVKEDPIQTSNAIQFKIDYGDTNEKVGFTDSLIPDKIEFSDFQSTSLQETSLKELNIQYL